VVSLVIVFAGHDKIVQKDFACNDGGFWKVVAIIGGLSQNML